MTGRTWNGPVIVTTAGEPVSVEPVQGVVQVKISTTFMEVKRLLKPADARKLADSLGYAANDAERQ